MKNATKRKYPRYFIPNKEVLIKKYEESTFWMVWAMVKERNGVIYYLANNGRFGSGEKTFTDFEITKEVFADDYVKKGFWIEVKEEELVLLV